MPKRPHRSDAGHTWATADCHPSGVRQRHSTGSTLALRRVANTDRGNFSNPSRSCQRVGRMQHRRTATKDLEGKLDVQQTDHMVREGAAGLGAVGLVVGLFAPPLLAATAVGAAIGAGAGKLLHRKTASKLEEQAGA